MNGRNSIKKAIEPLRQRIIHHQVYSAIENIEDLKVFMKYHVFAVWDFMSLLKILQNNLTCTTVPWFPRGSAETRYLINEIVLGEESDVDAEGNRKSHFEMYLDAMKQCGADADPIKKFILVLEKTGDLDGAFTASYAPKEAREFVSFTFRIIGSDKNHLQSAIFTFGREDLIPGMFVSLVNDLHKKIPESISLFKYYLERHIELDGDHHAGLSALMLTHVCGNDAKKWQEATQTAQEALTARIALWDGIAALI